MFRVITNRKGNGNEKIQYTAEGNYQGEPYLRADTGYVSHAGNHSAINGAGMGIATMFVLIMSNIVISLIKNLIPDKVRIPAFIVVIASFVTVIQLLMEAYVPSLYETLGVFIPLIVVNCIILGRAEAFASKHNVLDSALDGLGIGLGFTLSLTVIGAVREILGSGSVFGYKFIEGDGMIAFVLAPGAFLVLGYLMVLFNKATARLR